MVTRSIDILIKARDEASAKFGKVNQSAQSLQSGLLSLGKSLMGAFGVGFGLYQVVNFARSAISAFLEYENTVNKLRAALNLVGAGSAAAVRGMEAFADRIQSLTTYSNDAVLEIMAMGAAMGGLAGKDLEDATKAAIGLSQAYAIDLTAAMRLVARARVGDTAQLKKFGIVIEESLSPMEKFNTLLEIGAEKFALAEEATKSAAGQIKVLRNEWADTQRELGTWFMEEGPGRWFMELAIGTRDRIKESSDWHELEMSHLEQKEEALGSYLAVLGKIQGIEFFLQTPEGENRRAELMDRQAEAAQRLRKELANMALTYNMNRDAWEEILSARIETELPGHVLVAVKALRAAGDPLNWIRDLPLDELEKLNEELAKIPEEMEKLAAKEEDVRIGGFVAAMEKLAEEQAELERQAAVAAGVLSEMDAETAKFADTLGLTAEEADVLRGQLQAIADLKAQLGAEAPLPWVQWPERIMEDLEAETDAWLAKINKGLGEGPAVRGGGGLPAYIAQGIMRAPGQDPLVAAAQRAEKQRDETNRRLGEVVDVLGDRSTLPWKEAGLAN